MVNTTTISKSPPPLASLDFYLLRTKAIKLLQNQAGKSWTDHNLHDPGITILSNLCYAITDIGLRLDLPIEDILFSQNYENPDELLEQIKSSFPPATSTLPNDAWTNGDLRKILIDIPEIKNVFLRKANEGEVALYFNAETNLLSFNATPNKLTINGLYILKIEFQPNDLGDLNSNIVSDTIQITSGTDTQIYQVEFTLPYWDAIDSVWNTNSLIETIEIDTPFEDIEGTNGTNSFFGSVNITFDNGNVDTDFLFNARIQPPIEDESLLQDIIDALEILATRVTPERDGPYQVYKRKLEAIFPIVENVNLTFHQNRNLCEDLLRIEAIQIQEIAVFANIELLPGFNGETVLSKVYFALEQFFNPAIKKYSFENLHNNEKQSLEKIFQGPILENGFIKEEGLITALREDFVYTSDLVRLLMKFEEIFAVYELSISIFLNNEIVSGETPITDCLQLLNTDRFKPQLSINKSNITVTTQNNIPIDTSKASIIEQFNSLKEEYLQTSIDSTINLPLPKGSTLPLQSYYSIQNEFPIVYGVGKGDLAVSASPQRKAKAKQLKGFLSVFDQLLANYAAQISNTLRFFSPDDSLTSTYFTNPIYNIPDIDKLLVAHLHNNQSFSDFTQDENNAYITQLRSTAESKDRFLERRNRIMNHLLARLGEVYPNKFLLQYNGLSSYLIDDKIRFFKQHQTFSSQRGKAYNCHPDSEVADNLIWDTDNVSGFQKRLAGLLGMTNYQRRDLSPSINTNTFFNFITAENNTVHSFQLFDNNQNLILESIIFPTQIDAENASVIVVQEGMQLNRYGDIQVDDEGAFTIPFHDNTNTPIAHINGSLPATNNVNLDSVRLDAINEVRNTLLQFHKEIEGFYIVEHILLRPRANTESNLLPVVFDTYDNVIQLDSYSFHLSIIFPSGYQRNFTTSDTRTNHGSIRLRTPNFRAFLRKIIQEELPAHIMPHVYFLDVNTGASIIDEPSLNDFETAYHDWLTAKITQDEEEIVTSRNQLVAILTHLSRNTNA